MRASTMSNLSLLILLLVGCQHGLAMQLATLQKPDNVTLQWVSRQLDHNGVSMQVQQLHAKKLPLALLEDYQQLWRQSGYLTQQRSLARWQLLSTVIDNHNVVLQVESYGSGCRGFLSSIPINAIENRALRHDNFPRPWGTEQISKTLSNDAGARASTLVLRNNLSLAQNIRFYRHILRNNGWQIELDKITRGTATLFATNRHVNLELALRHEKGLAYIFANVRYQGSDYVF